VAIAAIPTNFRNLEVENTPGSGAPASEGTYLRSLTVSGFRGIGPPATLEAAPGPGSHITERCAQRLAGDYSFAMGQKGLRGRVAAAADAALEERKFVSVTEVCIGLGWLHATHVDSWRQGRVADLEQFLPVQQDRITEVIGYLVQWAAARGLTPEEIGQVAATRDRRQLRFTKNGDPDAESAWRTHWLALDLPAGQQQRITQRRSAPPDLVVVQPVKDWTCADCGGTGGLLIMDDAGPLCLTCADMDHLVFLPSGDAALTRRAKKASCLSAVVVRWSRTRKRYERQGLLVEEPALEQAEQQCLDDADARMRRRDRDAERRADQDVDLQQRFADEIVRLFPRCPRPRAQAIAAHAAQRSSGRVGRSAAGRNLDEKAITLAVVASVRHEDTSYDELLMSGVARAEARAQIKTPVDRVLAAWVDSAAANTTSS